MSFDGVSLFTNVPVDLAVRVTWECLDKSEDCKTACTNSQLTADDVADLLRLCLDIATFVYDSVHYKQIYGFMEQQWVHPCWQS